MTVHHKFTNLAAALAVSAVAAAVKKAEEFRAKAQECERRAEQASDSWAKHQFLECSNQWRTMAEQAERRIE